MTERINSFPDFNGSFGDKRIDKRATEALNKLVLGRSSSIRQITHKRAEQKAFYRLLDNEKFSEQNIERSMVKRCGQLCEGRHVLCIQDSSEVNLASHQGRIKQDSGIGKVATEGMIGFFVHACFVVDAHAGTPLGYSHVDIWNRPMAMANRHERQYKKQPIQDKESYKWIQATHKSVPELTLASQITVIADREADIYDLFGRYANTGVKLLIRAKNNRLIGDGSQRIIEYLAAQPVMHTYSTPINGDVRKGIQKRLAQLELKWARMQLCKPASCKDASLPAKVDATIVEAKENSTHSSPICWRIVTTHDATTVEQALQIIAWYRQRWHIEQVFRLLKLQAFRIESSQLEKGWAIRKLTMLALLAALRIMQMLLAYEDDNEQPLDEVFPKDEQQCMAQLNEKLQGQTHKLTNPHLSFTLRWAVWIIARLGGWKGYDSQRKPGPIVLHRGFIKSYHLYEGWILAQNYYKDVGTQ